MCIFINATRDKKGFDLCMSAEIRKKNIIYFFSEYHKRQEKRYFIFMHATIDKKSVMLCM